MITICSDRRGLNQARMARSEGEAGAAGLTTVASRPVCGPIAASLRAGPAEAAGPLHRLTSGTGLHRADRLGLVRIRLLLDAAGWASRAGGAGVRAALGLAS